MRFLKMQSPPPPPPPAVYRLELDYTDLHELYHMMLAVTVHGTAFRSEVERRFYMALKEHA